MCGLSSIGLAIILTSFAVTLAHAQWTTKASMSVARNDLAAGSINGMLYALGGKTANNCSGLTTVEAYDPTTDMWTTKAPMPVGRYGPSAVGIGGLLYVVGGDNHCSGAGFSELDAFDPATNSWSTKSPAPSPLAGVAAAALNDVLYVLGDNGTVQAYDPSTDGWTTKAPLPTPLTSPIAGAINNVLYAVGFPNGNGSTEMVEAYDPATNTWTTKTAVLPGRSGASGGVLNGILYFVGGADQTGLLTRVDAYDPASDTWTSVTPSLTPRYRFAVGAANGVLFAVGGGPDNGVVATNEAFSPALVSNTQFVQQGNKLVGTGGELNGYAVGQGSSTALSADGNTAIVGGYFDNSNLGAAWVFTRAGGVWTQQGNKLVGNDVVPGTNPSQGFAVAISADGNTAIVGAPGDNGGSGAALVYTRTGGVWSQQGSKLVGTGAVGNAQQGDAVSISADGNTAIVGGGPDNDGMGAAWVFTRTSGVWSQQGSKLVGTGAVGAANQATVSLSADGNIAILGGSFDNGNMGAAWVFTRTAGVWSQQGSKLVGTGAVGAAYQGYSVSLSGDGNTAMVGGILDDNGLGATWVFTRAGGVWTQQGDKLVGTGAVNNVPTPTEQGYSVSLSGDGNTALVGGASDNATIGAGWVFTRTEGVWSQQGGKLVGAGAIGAASQGAGVSLSADGNTAIVGGPTDNSYLGAAWVFTRGCIAPTIVTQPNDETVTNGTAASFSASASGAPLPDLQWQVSTNGGQSWNDIGGALSSPLIVAQAGFQQNGYQYRASFGNTCASAVYSDPATLTVKVRADDIGPVTLFVGVTNSDNNGRRIDLVADLYKNNLLIGTDTLKNQQVSGNALNNSRKFVIPVSISGTDFGPSDYLEADVSVRRVGGRGDFGVRFWFNSDSTSNTSHGWSRIFKAVSGGVSGDNYYYRSGNILATTQGTSGTSSTVTATAAFQSFGTWAIQGSLLKTVHGREPLGTDAVPSTYALDQNYPNPFNPSTTISYALPADAHVTLKVYDVLGKEVRTLVNEDSKAGTYETRFDASGLAGGVYLYRLQADGFVQSRKLMLLK